jgi:hypothetical protein
MRAEEQYQRDQGRRWGGLDGGGAAPAAVEGEHEQEEEVA